MILMYAMQNRPVGGAIAWRRPDYEWCPHRPNKMLLAYHLRLTLSTSCAELCCSRACLENGQDVMELGCGWGSLCLYVAAKYPKSRVAAVSNSTTQKEFIDRRCLERGLHNLTVITADVVTFDTKDSFDRVLSVEMFEHMKNYKVSLWQGHLVEISWMELE